MTVRELIKQLLDCDMDAEVSFVANDSEENYAVFSEFKVVDHGKNIEIDAFSEDVALVD